MSSILIVNSAKRLLRSSRWERPILFSSFAVEVPPAGEVARDEASSIWRLGVSGSDSMEISIALLNTVLFISFWLVDSAERLEILEATELPDMDSVDDSSPLDLDSRFTVAMLVYLTTRVVPVGKIKSFVFLTRTNLPGVFIKEGSFCTSGVRFRLPFNG